jgi:hypothetical protein
MRLWNLVKWALALGIIALTFMNASWIAPEPGGTLKLAAAHGAFGKNNCATRGSVQRAFFDKADMLMVAVKSAPGCVTFDEAIIQNPQRKFIADVSGGQGEAALAAFARANRPVDERYSFFGDTASLSTVRAKVPAAWSWSVDEARICFDDYVKLGWTGLVPASCKGKTILVPLDQKWKVWGWPKRFTARMDGARVHVILTGPSGANKALTGIATPEQIPEIPREFKGYLWVEDIGVIGPGLRS